MSRNCCKLYKKVLIIYNQKGGKKPASKKAANTDLETSNYDWNDMKEKILEALAKIVLLNIQKLWDPPIAEEQFVM